MLSRLIVDVYAWIIEFCLWLVLPLAGVAGYHFAAPVLESIGLIVEPHAGGKIVGAFIFSLAAFLASAVVMGPILVLFDIRKSIRSHEVREGSFAAWAQSNERKEPSL